MIVTLRRLLKQNTNRIMYPNFFILKLKILSQKFQKIKLNLMKI